MTTIDLDTRLFRVEITATTEIAAPPEAVWAVLADTAAYADWNPLVRRLEGRLAVGETIEVDFQPDPAQPVRTMRPRIVAVEPGRAFAWLGRVAIPGLLDGRHAFRVETTPTGSRLVQHEVLSGALVPFFRGLLTQDTPRAFAALNDSLAARVAARRTA